MGFISSCQLESANTCENLPFVELYNCTGRKYKDTCKVRCDAGVNATVLSDCVQCGSDGKWINLTRGEFF